MDALLSILRKKKASQRETLPFGLCIRDLTDLVWLCRTGTSMRSCQRRWRGPSMWRLPPMCFTLATTSRVRHPPMSDHSEICMHAKSDSSFISPCTCLGNQEQIAESFAHTKLCSSSHTPCMAMCDDVLLPQRSFFGIVAACILGC